MILWDFTLHCCTELTPQPQHASLQESELSINSHSTSLHDAQQAALHQHHERSVSLGVCKGEGSNATKPLLNMFVLFLSWPPVALQVPHFQTSASAPKTRRPAQLAKSSIRGTKTQTTATSAALAHRTLPQAQPASSAASHVQSPTRTALGVSALLAGVPSSQL